MVAVDARAIKLARLYATTRLAILKAVAPEAAAALADEEALLDALDRKHEEGAGKAIAAALAVLAGVSGVPSEEQLDRAVAVSQAAYNEVILPAAESATLARTPRIYRAAQMLRYRVTARRLQAAGKPVPLEVAPSFTLVDQAAVKAMAEQRLFWIGKHYEDVVAVRMRSAAQKLIIEGGLSARDAADKFREIMERQFGLIPGGPPPSAVVPAGWRGTTRDYYRMIVSNVATAARIAGAVRTYSQMNVQEVEWMTAGDERVCDRCEPMDGKRFKVEDEAALLDKILTAKTPEKAKEVAGWPSASRFKAVVRQSGHVSDEESARIVAEGWALPPLHGMCRCTLNPVID